MQIFDDLYEVGGVRSKLPDGSGPDRTPLPPPNPRAIGTVLLHRPNRGKKTHRSGWLFHAGISAKSNC